MDDDMFEPMNGDDPLGSSPASAPKRSWKRHYTRVPDEWKRRLHKAKRVSTYHLALELLYLHWKDGGDEPIVVSGKVAEMAGMCRRSKFNALTELQQLGLIRTMREPGQAPRAKLLHVRP